MGCPNESKYSLDPLQLLTYKEASLEALGCGWESLWVVHSTQINLKTILSLKNPVLIAFIRA